MTNIKYLQRFFIALFVGFSMCSLQACSEDDDNGGEDTDTLNTNVGEIVAGSGKKLLSAGYLDFYYTPEGKIKYIVENDEYDEYQAYHEFSSNQITSYYDYGSDEKEKEVLTLSHNEKGYISKIHMYEYDEYEGGGSETSSSTSDISYDGEGHVVKITGQGVDEYIYNGETGRFEYTQTINFKWDDGLLVGIESMQKNNEGWGYSESITFKYGDREYKNMHNQYAAFIDEMFGGIASACAYIGLFGTGPDYFPVSRTCRFKEFDDEGYEYTDTDSESYIYEFNEDGTIRRANSEYFTYGTIEEQGEFTPNENEYQTKATRAGQVQKRHSLFGTRMKSRR